MRHASLPVASAPPADEALARLIAAGDDDAFDELYRRYAGPLARYAGRMLRDPAAGEDVAQTALLNAYQALRRGNVPDHFKSWAYRIARNAALEAIERRGDSVPLLDGDAHGADDPMHVHAQRADLITALRTLPERQRAVYVLRELKGMRVGEIGAQLGLATEQVEQAMFAARNRLAEQLEFGERLDCSSVRSLADARLTRAQRRAVKSHLRACAACRSDAPALRVGALTVPALVDAARTALVWLFGGGSAAPIAAKAAAVVVAATAAGAAPVLVQHATSDAPSQAAQAGSAAPREQAATLGPFTLNLVRGTSRPAAERGRPAPGRHASTARRAVGAPRNVHVGVVERPRVETDDPAPEGRVDDAPAQSDPPPPTALVDDGPSREPVRDPEPNVDREPAPEPLGDPGLDPAPQREPEAEPVRDDTIVTAERPLEEATSSTNTNTRGDSARG